MRSWWARTAVLGVVALLGLLVVPLGNAPAKAATKQYYVSLGDSYSIGHQPERGATRHGYADQVVAKARRRGYKLELVNFGCAGATTMSILVGTRCRRPAIDGAPYHGRTQAAAAEKFIREHKGQIALVTVSIGGNDVTQCGQNSDPITCVPRTTNDMAINVTRLVGELRAAAGPDVPIVGLTYPDVILGQWVYEPVNQSLAQLSVAAFKSLVNPVLQQAYASAGAAFSDVTDATGAYIPFDQTVTVEPYGVIPAAVAKVCDLTYYCELGDIHAKTTGHKIIADLIVGQLPPKSVLLHPTHTRYGR